MKIIFIRHGQTKGNEEKRYIGRTDESLSQKGIEEIKNRLYPDVDTVLVSPMKRCVETAKIIYPDSKYIICNDFRECDFGIFEGKNYDELKNDSDYQKWIDSMGTMAIPQGESHEQFKTRCCNEFESIVKAFQGTAALIVHGGTIMAVLEKYAVPRSGFYSYQVKTVATLQDRFWQSMEGCRYEQRREEQRIQPRSNYGYGCDFSCRLWC